MRGIVLVILQIVISVLVVGLLLPAVLVSIPSSRESNHGTALAIVLAAAVFLLLRFSWPGRKRN